MHRKMVNPNLNPIRICRGNIVRVKLEEVCERGSSNLKQSDVVKMSGKYPIYGASGHIGNADFYHQDKPYVSVIKDGAGIGRAYLNSAKSSVIGTMQYLLPKNNVIPKYLYYVIRYMHLEKYYTGATIPHIYYKDYKNEQFNLASLEKQERVVEVLEKCEKIINNRRSEIGKLDELIKARFVEMFGDPVMNEKGWPTKPLLAMGQCKNGMNFHYNDEGVEINCLGVGDFKDFSSIDKTDELPTVSLNEMPSEEYLLKDDDIVFVRSNGNKALVGRSLAVYPGDVPTTFSGFCIRYRKYDNETIVPYLLRVLKTDSMRMKMAGRGANIQNLNQQILGTLIIPVPPIKLQKQFADFVHQVDKSKVVALNHLKNIAILLTICSIINENTNGKMGRRLYDN